MYIEISENSTIYVQVTDQKGKTYEKNRYIKCFDFTKPTLNAAVSDGLLIFRHMIRIPVSRQSMSMAMSLPTIRMVL